MTVSAASAGGTPCSSYSLARGAAGIALAHVVAARERTCPWAQARQSLAAMTSHPVAANIRYSGLYQGAPAVAFVLRYLVELTQPLRMPGRTLPGWWCATGPAGRPDPRWPGGHANLGMAHGIAVI